MVSPAQNNLIQSYLSALATPNAIATAVTAKAFAVARQEGAAAVQLLDSAAAADSGDSAGADTSLAGDSLVARATGLGGQLDVTA